MIYITMYLAAIILANLSSAHFGPSASVVNAFLFIGLDLTARDKLHDAWHGRGLTWKMGLLIAVGSLLSLLINYVIAIAFALPSIPDGASIKTIITLLPSFVNPFAKTIAMASMLAFGLAAVADTVAYHLLKNKAYLVKVNGSNVVSAAVDSLVFPTIAFGGFLPLITLGQFIAKVAGGFIWSIVLGKKQRAEVTYDL